MRTTWKTSVLILILAATTRADEPSVAKRAALGRPADGITATFSIVAVDPKAETCGAAVASKFPAVGKVVPYARAGAGAFCTQHWHNPKWGERALDLLAAEKLPEEVLTELLRHDEHRDKRQLAIIDLRGRAVALGPTNPDFPEDYSGTITGLNFACQGNTLANRKVLTAMAEAFESTEGSLADRLMSALIAADAAGGDRRGRLAAGIIVARNGTPGHWLDLQVEKSDDAVRELARKYAELQHDAKGSWADGKLPVVKPGDDPAKAKP